MLTIDRASTVSVQEQLVEQLRYLIASGQFALDETMPSTRGLASQLGLSFHTVRKAYQQLEAEGLLEGRRGSGFRVKERAPLDKGERMERGAAVVHDALHKLIGLGMEESEIDYLVQEQLELLATTRGGRKLLFTAASLEIAALCAEQVSRALQRHVEGVPLEFLPQHQDADAVIATHPDLHAVLNAVPRADALGVVVYLPHPATDRVARLLEHQSFGLVTRESATIPPFLARIRAATGFQGQMLGASIEQGARHLEGFVRQTDLILYTPGARRRLITHLGDTPSVEIAPLLSRDTLDALRESIPS